MAVNQPDANNNEYYTSASTLDEANWTVMFWVKFNASTGEHDIIHLSNGMLWIKRAASGDGSTVQAGLYDGNWWWGITAMTDTSKWYHVCVTHNSGDTAYIYTNGAQEGENSYNDTLNFGNFYIFDAGHPSYTMDGAVAGIKVWSRELSQAEIQQEMRFHLPVNPSGIWAAWPFITEPGCTIDFSGNGRTLTRVGSSMTTVDGPPIGFEWSSEKKIFIPAAAANSPITGSTTVSISPNDSTLKGTGDLDGSTTASITPNSSTLKGTGDLDGSTTATLTPSGTLSFANSQITGSTTVSVTPNASTLKGSGELTGADTATITPAGTLKGSTALTGSTTATLTPAGTATATGALTGSTAATITPNSSTLKGTGGVTGSTTATLTPAGTLKGDGAVTGSTTATLTPSGTLKGGTALTGSTTVTLTPTGDLTAVGAGQITGSLSFSVTPSATLTGTLDLTGSTTATLTPTATLTLKSSGAMTGATTATIIPIGTAKGAGKLIGSLAATVILSAVLSATGALAATTTATLTPSAELKGKTSLTGDTTNTFTPAGTLKGNGTVTGNTTVTLTPTGNLTATQSGAITGATSLTLTLEGILSGGGTVPITGDTTISLTLSATLSDAFPPTHTAFKIRALGVDRTLGAWDTTTCTYAGTMLWERDCANTVRLSGMQYRDAKYLSIYHTGSWTLGNASVLGVLDWSTTYSLAKVFAAVQTGSLDGERWFEFVAGTMYTCVHWNGTDYKLAMN